VQSHAKDFCLILQSGPNSNKVSSWFLKLHIEEIKTTIIKELAHLELRHMNSMGYSKNTFPHHIDQWGFL